MPSFSPCSLSEKLGNSIPVQSYAFSILFVYVALERLKQCKERFYVYRKPLETSIVNCFTELVMTKGLKQIIPSLLCLFPFALSADQ